MWIAPNHLSSDKFGPAFLGVFYLQYRSPVGFPQGRYFCSLLPRDNSNHVPLLDAAFPEGLQIGTANEVA
jgi:hypothetical protein